MATRIGDEFLQVTASLSTSDMGRSKLEQVELQLRVERNATTGDSVVGWYVYNDDGKYYFGGTNFGEDARSIIFGLASGEWTKVGHARARVYERDVPELRVWLDEKLENGQLGSMLLNDGFTIILHDVDAVMPFHSSSNQFRQYLGGLLLKFEQHPAGVQLLWNIEVNGSIFRGAEDGQYAVDLVRMLASSTDYYIPFGALRLRLLSEEERANLRVWLDSMEEHGQLGAVEDEEDMDALWSQFYQSEWWGHRYGKKQRAGFVFNPSLTAAEARAVLVADFPGALDPSLEAGSPVPAAQELMRQRETAEAALRMQVKREKAARVVAKTRRYQEKQKALDPEAFRAKKTAINREWYARDKASMTPEELLEWRAYHAEKKRQQRAAMTPEQLEAQRLRNKAYDDARREKKREQDRERWRKKQAEKKG